MTAGCQDRPHKGRNVSVITGNSCLKVLFTKQEYRERLSGTENRAAAYIMEKTDDWFRYNDEATAFTVSITGM